MADPSWDLDLRADAGALSLAATIRASGTVVLLGPNGSGKTTLIRALLGLHPATGLARVADHTLLDTGAGVDLPPEQRGLGWVPQTSAIFPHLSVLKNLQFGSRPCDQRDRRQSRADADSLLESLQISHLAQRPGHALSGGERQRVALARALASRPRALLLDEPLAALDAAGRPALRDLLVQTLTARSLPALITTHDPDDARALGGTVALLEQGRITWTGPLASLGSAPDTPFVRALIG